MIISDIEKALWGTKPESQCKDKSTKQTEQGLEDLAHPTDRSCTWKVLLTLQKVKEALKV
jgi:hypothetical protein